MSLTVGHAVSFRGAPGIGRVGAIDGNRVRVDFFESAAEPVVGSVWKDLAEVRRVELEEETRAFFRDAEGLWRVGRVVGGRDGYYFVKLPNARRGIDIDEDQLRVRWERPPRDPFQVFLSGANETPRYRDARQPVRNLLLAERAATASATGIMSSGVQIHAHQISAALRVIRDPVQRYLLADEVGMGKTIEAGMVMRQLLIDSPGRRIGLIVPDALISQWRLELLEKFYLDDFPTPDGGLPFQILGHGDVDEWSNLVGVDLLVVDEAHVLARATSPDDSPYRDLAALAHTTDRILMLSATPFERGASTHLALLHLLDPQLFRWEEQVRFGELLSARRELALAVFGLDPEPDPQNPELLSLQFDEIKALLPEDELLRAAMARAMAVFGASGNRPLDADAQELQRAVDSIRTHISETYRLHHRVVRNRRHEIEKQRLDDDGLLAPFEFTGRTRPVIRRLQSLEAGAGAAAVAEWAVLVGRAILDGALEPGPFGRVAGVLQSRVGGPVRDLWHALEFRLSRGSANDSLTRAEREDLSAAPVQPFEQELADRLADAVGTDGLADLGDVVAGLSPSRARVVVFCGRGSLARELQRDLGARGGSELPIYEHVDEQSDDEREEATRRWRTTGGCLVADSSGEVGRNLQDADVVIHIRTPSNPNALEQRIGRVDRYGTRSPAMQFVLGDPGADGLSTAWLRLLTEGFGVFDDSISAYQEVVDSLADDAWVTLVTHGVERFLALAVQIRDSIHTERSRINELDALESSFGAHMDGDEMAIAIARYEEDSKGLESAYRLLIAGAEGFRLEVVTNHDGSLTFRRDPSDPPLFSPRLLRRLIGVQPARTGFFDRWRLKSGRRLFRLGNPFMDGVRSLLELDDRGQAVAMWRWIPRWSEGPLVCFGVDFLVEANLEPLLRVMPWNGSSEPIARRRADAALPPRHQRVWVSASSFAAVDDRALVGLLDLPFSQGRDQNLNYDRIGALYSLVGGKARLAPLALGCLDVARKQVDVAADVTEASQRAGMHVRRETEFLVAQSRARSRAAGLVADPAALEAEIAMGRALEEGVLAPTVRVSGVSCVVVSAQPWADHV